MQIKRLGWLALGLAGAVTLAACGGGKSGTGGGAPAQTTATGQAEGTVTFWDTSDATNEAPSFKQLVAKFEASHPKIKVNYVTVPFDQAQEKFRTAAQSNSGAPDVLRSEVAWTPDFASLGYLADLTSAVGDTSDFLPTPLSSNQLDGKVYGIPQVTDAPALLYNKAMLTKAGVQPPTTWAELQTAAAKIKSANPGSDAYYLNAQGYFLLPFLYSEGGDLLNAAEKKITVSSPDAVRGLQDALDLVKAGSVKADATSDAYNNMMTAFKTGKAAMITTGPWELKNIKSSPLFTDGTNLGIAPTPAGSSGKRGSPVGGHNYVVYSKSASTAAAVEFITWMDSAENQAFLAKQLGLLPTRKSAYDLPDVQANPQVAAFKEIMAGATARPWIPEGGGLFAALDAEYPKAVKNAKDAKAAQNALDAVARTWKSSVVTDYTIG
ncbi:MAG: extracellular solute-binding protein [Actinobacteria bacterium]|nr:extracellular solute-binding protein [Actinomycetota bacterium]MBI3687591.1 extracellular solute-binding protein [Actinomycetota bacterium]